MPEGPEIRIEADRIEGVLRGELVEQAWFARPELQRRAGDIVGRRVSAVETRGKALLTHFDNDVVLYTHNQLYGRWYVRPRGELPHTGRSLRVALHTARGSALLYSASAIELLDRAMLSAHPFLARLGPDALSAARRGSMSRRSAVGRSAASTSTSTSSPGSATTCVPRSCSSHVSRRGANRAISVAVSAVGWLAVRSRSRGAPTARAG